MSDNPVSIRITFADGSTREAGLNDISKALQTELTKLGLMESASNSDQNGKYILVEWTDGWREVFNVPEAVTDLRKYYVIHREEQVGRLFLDKEDAYPELLEVHRKPEDVKKVSLI